MFLFLYMFASHTFLCQYASKGDGKDHVNTPFNILLSIFKLVLYLLLNFINNKLNKNSIFIHF